ncbi:hypothetical protein C8R47DRAFT_1082120 [Mycena vitilis]|nr:hypothetical protein C8R47DRAFT_1082120 [Mycena vitilis]
MRVDDETRRLMGSIYSHRYYRKHREERNRKTRERMARLRAEEASLPPDVLESRLEARRKAACRYREKNRRQIALKARERRAQLRLPLADSKSAWVGTSVGSNACHASLVVLASSATLGAVQVALSASTERENTVGAGNLRNCLAPKIKHGKDGMGAHAGSKYHPRPGCCLWCWTWRAEAGAQEHLNGQLFPGTAMSPCKPGVPDSKYQGTNEEQNGDDDVPQLVLQEEDSDDELPELVPQDQDVADEARTACAAAFWSYRAAPAESHFIFRAYRRRQTHFLSSADSQIGERYAAADFSLTLSALSALDAPVLAAHSSYDLACAGAYLKTKPQLSKKRAWADLPDVTCVCHKSHGIDRQSCPYEGHSVAARAGAHWILRGKL